MPDVLRPLDPHALKLYTDGNAYDNPGGTGGFACVAEYPESWNRENEVIRKAGFHETNNNRMELRGCIAALEYVANEGQAIGVQRVQIVTDSMYVDTGQRMAHIWRAQGWKNASGRPVENSDLWKRYLGLRLQIRTRTDIVWRKGKKGDALKLVDKSAKAAGKSPSKDDRGFRTGKIGRSKLKGGSATLFHAAGQVQTIHIYRSALLRKTEHKIYFDVFNDARGEFTEKCTAYVPMELIDSMHRGHTYRVQFNCDVNNPRVLAILKELLPGVGDV
jgi:ribonuclease HI